MYDCTYISEIKVFLEIFENLIEIGCGPAT